MLSDVLCCLSGRWAGSKGKATSPPFLALISHQYISREPEEGVGRLEEVITAGGKPLTVTLQVPSIKAQKLDGRRIKGRARLRHTQLE